jgi:GntR family transcriptional regulator of vanillate catabolism
LMTRVANSGYLENKVYTEIKEMIINGELKPGELIIQDQMARRIGVSRTPLRRAFVELERDYLLETTAQGLSIRRFSGDFLISVWEVRAVLEGLACRLSVSVIDKATIEYLRTLFTTAYEQWKEHDDLEAYRKADIVFHTKLVEMGGNPILKNNFSNTHVLTIAFSRGILRSPTETYPEHIAILDELEQKNEEKAEQLMLDHLRKTIPQIRNAFL